MIVKRVHIDKCQYERARPPFEPVRGFTIINIIKVAESSAEECAELDCMSGRMVSLSQCCFVSASRCRRQCQSQGPSFQVIPFVPRKDKPETQTQEPSFICETDCGARRPRMLSGSRRANNSTKQYEMISHEELCHVLCN